MQTSLDIKTLPSQQLSLADDILRSCVHCGFCTAVCPTYQVLGNELDSPRGRIYLIKQVLEGKPISAKTHTHLDRCLMCRSCETACPSGVEYYQLLNFGKTAIARFHQPSWLMSLKQNLVRKFLTSGKFFNLTIKFSSVLRDLLPTNLKRQIPRFSQQSISPASVSASIDKVLLLGGCAQPVLTPEVNNATIRILQKLSIAVIADDQNICCGAIDYHLSAKHEALVKVKINVDRWFDALQNGVSTIISNASGCGAMVKDYAKILSDDSEYQAKAEYVVTHTMDIAEYLANQDLSSFKTDRSTNIAFHPPCTLQHWQGLSGKVERILEQAGFTLLPIENESICCGSAGAYSIMQSKIANDLKTRKLKDLMINKPREIVTANVGCILHLQSGTDLKVRHWIELLDSIS